MQEILHGVNLVVQLLNMANKLISYNTIPVSILVLFFFNNSFADEAISDSNIQAKPLDITITPDKQTIVLLGKKRTINIYCSDELSPEFCIKASLLEEDKEDQTIKVTGNEGNMYLFNKQNSHYPVKILSQESYFEANKTNKGASHASVDILGLRPGRVQLKLQLLHHNSNQTQLGVLDKDYEVIVAEQLNLLHDAFVYILCTIQFLAMFLLGLRMRGAATKEIIVRPCALITALITQTVFVPLVYLGASIVLSLDEHVTVTLLLVGCSPTAVVGAMMAVVQQAHVELAIVLLLVQTVIAFGTMPGWLFTYGHFLGVAYKEVAFPYFHLTAAVGAVALPTVLGICLRRCTPRVLPRLDKAIQPVSLLVVMVAVTVSIYNFMENWALITWNILVASTCIPLACLLLGVTVCAVFKQKVPQLKAVAMATALQNTLLTTTIIQTFYSVETSSVMAVTIACLDLMSLSILFLLYLIHIILWVTWPMYRMHHDNIGISGISKSFSERLVRNMLKAGEIRFCSRVNTKKKQGNHNMNPDSTPFCAAVGGSSQTSSLATISNTLSGSIHEGKQPPTCLSNNSLVKSMSTRMANLNLSFLGSLQPKVEEYGEGNTDTINSQESDLSLHYFITPQHTDNTDVSKQNQSDEADKDSPSIDYSIIVNKETDSLQRPFVEVHHHHRPPLLDIHQIPASNSDHHQHQNPVLSYHQQQDHIANINNTMESAPKIECQLETVAATLIEKNNNDMEKQLGMIKRESGINTLDMMKEMDKQSGYVNCTGKAAMTNNKFPNNVNNISDVSHICECAEEELENTTNDVIEIIVASTMPPVVTVEKHPGGSQPMPSITVKGNKNILDDINKSMHCGDDSCNLNNSEKDSSIWIDERL